MMHRETIEAHSDQVEQETLLQEHLPGGPRAASKEYELGAKSRRSLSEEYGEVQVEEGSYGGSAEEEPHPPVHPGGARMNLFFLLVGAYIAPLAWALAREGVYHRGETRPRYLGADPSVASVVVWCVLCLGLYWTQRAAGAFFKWKMHDKVSATHKEDVFRMTLLNALLSVGGRVGARLDEGALVFVGLSIVYTFAFGVLFEMVRHCNIEFTRECVANPYSLFFAAFLVLVLSALAVNHLSLVAATAASPDTSLTLLDALCLCLFVVALHVGLSLAPGHSSAHWHHWYTGFLGALFSVFDTHSSRVAQAMMIGIYLHGAALFGIEPCFTTDPS